MKTLTIANDAGETLEIEIISARRDWGDSVEAATTINDVGNFELSNGDLIYASVEFVYVDEAGEKKEGTASKYCLAATNKGGFLTGGIEELNEGEETDGNLPDGFDVLDIIIAASQAGLFAETAEDMVSAKIAEQRGELLAEKTREFTATKLYFIDDAYIVIEENGGDRGAWQTSPGVCGYFARVREISKEDAEKEFGVELESDN